MAKVDSLPAVAASTIEPGFDAETTIHEVTVIHLPSSHTPGHTPLKLKPGVIVQLIGKAANRRASFDNTVTGELRASMRRITGAADNLYELNGYMAFPVGEAFGIAMVRLDLLGSVAGERLQLADGTTFADALAAANP